MANFLAWGKLVLYIIIGVLMLAIGLWLLSRRFGKGEGGTPLSVKPNDSL